MTRGADGVLWRPARHGVEVTLDTLVVLVRHASASDADRWTGDDTRRPLDGRGHDQAAACRRILPLFAATRLLSVDNRRCRDTLTPLAADLTLPVEPDQAFEERHHAAKPAAGEGSNRCW